MPKPLTNAVAQLIVSSELDFLERSLAKVEAEFQASTQPWPHNHRDRETARSIYVQLALCGLVGAMAGDDAEKKVRAILGFTPDSSSLHGSSARSSAEDSVYWARRRAKAAQAQQGASA